MDFKDGGLAILISIFLLAIVGIAFAEVISNSLTSMDDENTLVNETIAIASSIGTTANGDLSGITAIRNSTILTNNTFLEVGIAVADGRGTLENAQVFGISAVNNGTNIMQVSDADFNFTVNGTIFINATWADGDFNVTYTYTPDGLYIPGSNVDFNFTDSGDSIFVNSSTSDGDYLITYTYEPSTFVDDPTSRTIINIVMIFFVIGILLFIIAWFMKSQIREFLDGR